jgi:tRNA threonylcarbamoyl adenosine modification protein YeaZ
MKRWTLALDTSTSRAHVGLVEESSPDGDRAESPVALLLSSSGINSHHEELSLLVERVLETASAPSAAISRVVVGAGPGSFTGLRIGYSFARGFSLSLGVPLFGVSSLLGAAWEFRAQSSGLVSLLDAGRGELFVGVYRSDGERLSEVHAPEIVPRDTLTRHVERVLGGVSPLYVSLAEGETTECRIPRAVTVGLVDAFRAEGRTEPRPLDLAPEYLRAVAAKTIAERRGAA